jgi:O-antigen/teichoic acid export membrane protein
MFLRVGRRVGWGILDQTASSLTNFALGVFVARQTTTEVFGAFALAFITYLLCLNLGRAAVANPLLIRYSNVSSDRWRHGVRGGVGAAFVVGAAGGALCIAGGLVAGGELGAALIATGIVLPATLVQDAWRYCFFAAGRGRDAFFNDALRGVLLVPSFGALMLADVRSVAAPILAWGLAALAAAAFGAVQSGQVPRGAQVRGWFDEHRDMIPRFVGESITMVGSLQLSYFLIGAIGGLSVVGSIRAAELILGPFNILSMGAVLVAVPEMTRLLARSRGALVRGCVLMSGVLSLTGITFGLACTFLPDPIGRALVGSSWESASGVLIPLTLAMTGMVAGSGPRAGLRALEEAGRILRIAVITSTATLAGAVIGVAAGGLQGAAWGLALGGAVGAAASWLAFRGALVRLPAASRTPASTDR